MSDHEEHHEDGHCHSPEHDSGRANRREFLRRSIGGLLGFTLGAPMFGMLAGNPGAGLATLWADDPLAEPAKRAAQIKSIVLLWLDGGPSHLDTFDPKPGHTNGGPFKAIKTAQPGVLLSEHLPGLASIADRAVFLRSMTTGEGNHSRAKHLLKSGYAPQGTVNFPGMGAMVAHELGDQGLAIPANVSINAPGFPAGFLGVRYDPFYVNDPAKPVQNLALPKGVDENRFQRRMALLAHQQKQFAGRIGAQAADVESYDKINASARAFMDAPQAKAFDISSEPTAVQESYGDSKFGRGCLMARRLVESGVRFVEVFLGGWDTHDDNFTRVQANLAQLDPAITALTKDLEARDLLRSTLIICMGEFGRTPKINAREGRDHYPRAWTSVLLGGGIRPGVIGATNEDGTEVIADPIKAPDLFRTIYTIAGIDPNREFQTPGGRPIKIANGGQVIAGV